MGSYRQLRYGRSIPLLLALISTSAFGVECFGNGPKHLIYLHGMGDKHTTGHVNLGWLAEELNATISESTSQYSCSNTNWACWRYGNKSDIDEILSQVNYESFKCFSGAVDGYIGFSDGGWFLNQLYQYCEDPKLELYSIGSAGWDVGEKNLGQCGLLHMYIGDLDPTYRKAMDFYRLMGKKNAHVIIRQFHGGHEIPHRILQQK